jgi:very-short-patch-repair endonuclease
MRGAKPIRTKVVRRLRRDSTIAEVKLWNRLRSRTLGGFKFVRQASIGPFIVDFACREQRLIVEVDGGQHAENQDDITRTEWLQCRGYTVLRFWNNDVLGNVEGVLEQIVAALHDPLTRDDKAGA